MESISWSHYPLVANHDQAHRWLQFTANIGRAPNTIEAYGHALEDHLQFCASAGDPRAVWYRRFFPVPHGAATRCSAGVEPADSRSPATAGTAALRTSSRTRGKPTRGRAQRAIATPGTAPLVGTASSRTAGAARLRFRIRFQAERFFEANDIRDALRQAESLGAVEITSVAREDQ
jgi:hypothetical protein